MKHGPIALIDKHMPVVFLAPHDQTYEKIFSNIQEVKARKGIVISVTDKRTKDLENISDFIIDLPSSHPRIFPLLASISPSVVGLPFSCFERNQCGSTAESCQERNSRISLTISRLIEILILNKPQYFWGFVFYGSFFCKLDLK